MNKKISKKQIVERCNIKFNSKYDYSLVPDFDEIKMRDNIKNDFCEKNNIKLIRIPYWDINNIEKILEKEIIIND